MSKFRYYITDLFDGCVKGSNDRDCVMDFANCEDYFVIDTETNEWLQADGGVQIKETGHGDDA